MTNWKEYKLGDLCTITSSKRIFYNEYVSEGVPFFRSKEIIEKANGNNISIDGSRTHWVIVLCFLLWKTQT